MPAGESPPLRRIISLQPGNSSRENDLLRMLDGLAYQSEVGGRRKHVAVIGPHSPFSDLLRRHKMDCVGGAYEEIAGSGNHQRTGPPQQSFVDGSEVPQSVLYVLGEAQGQFARIAG
jgi:hypothetical protein